MSFKKLLTYTFILLCGKNLSQSFDIEQAAQLIRPRLKTEGRFLLNTGFRDTAVNFSCFEQSVNFTFPIKRKFSADIRLDLKSLKPKDILKNSVRLKAYDILGTVRVSSRQLQLGFDSVPQKQLFGINAGITGLHLTKSYRIAFYSFNAYIHEQDRFITSPAIRLSALAGGYHIRGLRKSFYYGAALIYSDGLLLPAPFVGGTEKLSKNWYFNYTLPVQMNAEYNNGKQRLLIGAKADGFRSALLYRQKRHAINYTQGCAYVNYRYRFSNTFYAFAEGGYVFYHRLSLSETSGRNEIYTMKGAPYLQAGFFAFFGKSLLEKIIEQLF